jgi:hypothetical protein
MCGGRWSDREGPCSTPLPTTSSLETEVTASMPICANLSCLPPTPLHHHRMLCTHMPPRPPAMQYKPKKTLPEDCVDEEEMCEEWAQAGECDKNPQYMRGDPFSLGICRSACGECQPCDVGDAACRAQNRRDAGFLVLEDEEEAEAEAEAAIQ